MTTTKTPLNISFDVFCLSSVCIFFFIIIIEANIKEIIQDLNNIPMMMSVTHVCISKGRNLW
jgi:hypothetical protein